MTPTAIFTVMTTLVGSLLVAGIFYAFSSFVMKALARLPASEGMAAMQSINVVVLNPSFLGVFMGTAVLSVLVIVLAVKAWGAAGAPWLVAGALAYLIGTFFVTGLGNVPLNEKLAAASAANAAGDGLWAEYLVRWTRLNTIRTLAAMAAAGLMLVGIMKMGA